MAFISLSNVSFGYDADDNLLDAVSCVFNSSERVAIVGDNGAGKSTLLRLLSGDLSPNSGVVAKNANVYMVEQINAMDSKSGGEAQIDALLRAFDSGAEILLLDEPTNNLLDLFIGFFITFLCAGSFPSARQGSSPLIISVFISLKLNTFFLSSLLIISSALT